jgi:hypothetical protein
MFLPVAQLGRRVLPRRTMRYAGRSERLADDIKLQRLHYRLEQAKIKNILFQNLTHSSVDSRIEIFMSHESHMPDTLTRYIKTVLNILKGAPTMELHVRNPNV